MNLVEPGPRSRPPAQSKRALRLSPDQLGRLVDAYKSRATVYELGAQFGIERRTVAVQLKRQGVTLRRQSPTSTEVDEIVRLYGSGLSLETVGQRLGFAARTAQRYLEVRGVQRRDTHGRLRAHDPLPVTIRYSQTLARVIGHASKFPDAVYPYRLFM